MKTHINANSVTQTGKTFQKTKEMPRCFRNRKRINTMKRLNTNGNGFWRLPKRISMACWDAHCTHSKCVQMRFRTWKTNHKEIKTQSKTELSCVKKQIKLYLFCNLQCCCGKALVRLVFCNVAVVKLLLFLTLAVLLWCNSCSFCCLHCWCRKAFARFVICNVAVMHFLFVLTFTMLLWCSSCSLWDVQSCCNALVGRFVSLCCCGEAPAGFVIRNVAVVRILFVFALAMLAWYEFLQASSKHWKHI